MSLLKWWKLFWEGLPDEKPAQVTAKRTPNKLPRLLPGMPNDNTQAQTMAGGWDQVMCGSDYHTVPRDDLKPHTDTNCWCHPAIDYADNGAMIVVHNAMDRREFVTRYH